MKPGSTKEHYWPFLLRKYIPALSAHYIHTKTGPRGVRRDNGKVEQGNLRGRQIKAVCEPCNGGWMKRVNEAAEASLGRLSSGDFFIFDDERLAVATWMTMFTMSYEFQDYETMASRQIDRTFLMDNLQPPPDWIIMVGIHHAPDWVERTHHTGFGIWRPENAPQGEIRETFRESPHCNFQTTVSTFGTMAFNTISAHSDALAFLDLDEIVASAAVCGFQVLWPINAPIVAPEGAIASDGMDVVAKLLGEAFDQG